MSEKANVVMYTSAGCMYCSGAKNLLDKKGVEYTEIRVDLEPAMRDEMEHRSGRETVPQIFINDVAIGGFDELMDLDLDDELDPMLGLN